MSTASSTMIPMQMRTLRSLPISSRATCCSQAAPKNSPQQCVEAAKGKVEYLKSAVPRVAARNGVNTADLANYLAYRLSLQNINWWGAATNLQSGEVDPWVVARDQFFRCADLGALNELDRGLLSQALAGYKAS